jgi:acyl-CoA synthetase (AMP-forming)/AMP-acid ligase II
MSQTVDAMFINAGRRYGSRPAWKAPNGDRTYEEILAQGVRLAHTLRAAGLAPGDRVAMMLDDVAEAIEVFAGIVLAGLVVVPVNRDFKRDELDFILTDSGARGLIYTDSAAAAVEESDATDALQIIIAVGDKTPLTKGAVRYLDAVAKASSALPEAGRSPEDTAMLAYTSGTTGFPKGAIISHGAILLCARTSQASLGMGNYTRLAHSGSLQFTAPWWAMLLPVLYGGGFVRLLGKYTPESWFDTMAADRSTYTYVPSPLMQTFAELGRRRPDVIDGLSTVLHSGSLAPREHVAELVDVVGARFVEGYGMTETVGSITTITRADHLYGRDEAEDFFASGGRAAPTASVSIVDEQGNEIPPGSNEVGEILVECDTMFRGYWNRPEQTADAFAGERFRTGDLGRLDAAGYLYVAGRKTDLIISGGANVYAAELERVLIGMPGVADCAIVGVPHERWGEAVAAAVVAAPGADLTAGDVVSYMRERLAGYKKPQSVVFVDELPRNASMKLQKHAVRELIIDHQQTRVGS